jgi:peptidyl-prolyl cis-trans isomerase C
MFLLLGLIALLVLSACAGQDEGKQPTAPVDQATVIVATVAPSAGPSTVPPTAVPATAAPTPTPTPPAPAAAVVNGQYILLDSFERRVAQYEEALLAGGLDPSSEEGQASLAQIRTDVLESLIDYVLVEQGAASLGVTLSDAELEAQIQADIEAGGGQASFDEWLQATDQTRDDYKAMLRESMLSQRVLDAVTGAIPEATEQVHARHIVVATEEQARQILAELQGGADFAALAREQSLDVATRDNGGDLGWFPRGLVDPELERAAFALQPGEFSDVVALGEGYHIIQVVERDAARPLSPETQIDLRLALFDQWLAEQRAAADIVRFVGE